MRPMAQHLLEQPGHLLLDQGQALLAVARRPQPIGLRAENGEQVFDNVRIVVGDDDIRLFSHRLLLFQRMKDKG